jgi:hypothetical protein
MNGIMEKIRQLMAGRYGNDFLNAALFIFGAVISVVCSLFKIPFGSLISFIPYGIALYRMLSKDYTKRSAENARFLELSKPWRDFFMKKFRQLQDKDHRYYACPQCHNTLRVPKGRGKIKISCPHCAKEFIRKT